MQKLLQILCFVIFLSQKQIITSIEQTKKNIDYLKDTFYFFSINTSIPSEIQVIFDQSKKFHEAIKMNNLQNFLNNNRAPTHIPNQKKIIIYNLTPPIKQYNPCLKFLESLNDENHINYKLIKKYNQATEQEKPNVLQKLTKLFIKESIKDYEKYIIIQHVKTLINKTPTQSINKHNFCNEFLSKFTKQEGIILTNFIQYFLQKELNKEDSLNLILKYPIQAIKTQINNQENICKFSFFPEIIELCKLEMIKKDNNNIQSNLYEYEEQISSILKINNTDDLKKIFKKNQQDPNDLLFFQIYISIMKNSSINEIDKKNLIILLQKTINDNDQNNLSILNFNKLALDIFNTFQEELKNFTNIFEINNILIIKEQLQKYKHNNDKFNQIIFNINTIMKNTDPNLQPITLLEESDKRIVEKGKLLKKLNNCIYLISNLKDINKKNEQETSLEKCINIAINIELIPQSIFTILNKIASFETQFSKKTKSSKNELEQKKEKLDHNIINFACTKNCNKILKETINISKQYYKKYQLILEKLKKINNQTLNNSENKIPLVEPKEIKNDCNSYNQNIQDISMVLDENAMLWNNATLNIQNEIKKENHTTKNTHLSSQEELKNQLMPFLLIALSKMKQEESKSESQIFQKLIKALKDTIENTEKSIKSENNEALIQLTREQRENEEEKIYYQTIYKKKQAICNPLNKQIINLINQLKIEVHNWIKIPFKNDNNTLINQTMEKIQSKSITFNEILQELQKIESLYDNKNTIHFNINKEKENFEKIQDKLMLLQNQKKISINKLTKEMEENRYKNLKKIQIRQQEIIKHYKQKEYQNINFNKKEQKITIISMTFISLMLIYTIYSNRDIKDNKN